MKMRMALCSVLPLLMLMAVSARAFSATDLCPKGYRLETGGASAASGPAKFCCVKDAPGCEVKINGKVVKTVAAGSAEQCLALLNFGPGVWDSCRPYIDHLKGQGHTPTEITFGGIVIKKGDCGSMFNCRVHPTHGPVHDIGCGYYSFNADSVADCKSKLDTPQMLDCKRVPASCPTKPPYDLTITSGRGIASLNVFLPTQDLKSIKCAAAPKEICESKSNGIQLGGSNPGQFATPRACLAASFTQKAWVCLNISKNPGQFPVGKAYPYTIELGATVIGRGECPAAEPTGGVITLPNVGTVTNCKTSVPVTGMHYPNQTCAQSQANFLAGAMTSHHFKSKCSGGTTLLGVSGISCQNAPIPGFNTGSVYKGTACCAAAASKQICESKSNGIQLGGSNPGQFPTNQQCLAVHFTQKAWVCTNIARNRGQFPGYPRKRYPYTIELGRVVIGKGVCP